MFKPAARATGLTPVAIFMTAGRRTNSLSVLWPRGHMIGNRVARTLGNSGEQHRLLHRSSEGDVADTRSASLAVPNAQFGSARSVIVKPVSSVLVSMTKPQTVSQSEVQSNTSFETEMEFSPQNTVDLATVLALAGANNWNVEIAKEQAIQAEAGYNAARAMWSPDFRWGVGYTGHDGQIQGTNGQVIDVTRQSLFVAGRSKRLHPRHRTTLDIVP